VSQKRTTIKDLAKAAKLSPSTVSRALNDHPRIGAKTKKRVQKLARSMGYTPNLLARGLVTQKNFLLGLLVYDFRNPFYAELTRSIQDTAEEHGFWLIQSSTDDDPDKSRLLVDSMMRVGVEGLIFASCQLEDPLVEALLDQGFPLMLANRRLRKDRGNYVVMDNVYGAYLVVNHLIRLGYRRIAMIRGPHGLSTSADRYQGYLEAMQEKGLEIDRELVKEGPFFSQETGYTFTRRLMRLRQPPEAIFCGDDYMALGAMKALAEMELKVPEDVGLVGFDDAEISSHPQIQLTTVSQDAQEMGRRATRILLQAIAGKLPEPQHILLEPHLVIRESCGYKLRSQPQPQAGLAT
jgi:DNA-binding LacI/PurR family transcriptional regulator